MPISTAAGRAGTLTPYLAVRGAKEALEWYCRVLGASLRGELIMMPDGRLGHAELEIGNGLLMLADEFPEIGHEAPRAGGGAAVTLHLEVHDVAGVAERARSAGATIERPVDETEGGRATVRDPYGHRWLLSPVSEPAPTGALRPGDAAYLSLEVPDVTKAMTFYGAVLGWQFEAGSSQQARQVQRIRPGLGVIGGQDRGNLIACWYVADIAAALERVRSLGGQAEAPLDNDFGPTASCVDDQGERFYVWQPPAGQAPGGATAKRPLNGVREGDISYLTLQVQDAARTLRFFGHLLDWRFRPGRVEDGWAVADVMPITGLAGGHSRMTGVPMYRVDDIQAAVGRVRAAGGSATDPGQQRFGLMAECVDDQGTAFYLGQHMEVAAIVAKERE